MGTPPPKELTGGYSYPKFASTTVLSERGNGAIGSVDPGYFDDELTASIKSLPRNSSKTYNTSVQSNRYTTSSSTDRVDALEAELRITTQKKDEYLEVIVNQADAIKELREQLKEKNSYIKNLQDKLLKVK